MRRRNLRKKETSRIGFRVSSIGEKRSLDSGRKVCYSVLKALVQMLVADSDWIPE